MKKYLFIAAAAVAMLAACQVKEELAFNAKQDAVAENGIHFDVYTQRGVATRGGVPGDVTNDNIGDLGFGVFAYYTMGEKYDPNAKPNFMYNQKVYKDAEVWKYEPVKYWPNEFGDAAISDEVDYVTFFAYAPYTEFEPTTGDVKAANEKEQKYNIISVNKNTATGDPIIKYVVDTDPATSVDLLWGVAAATAKDKYSAIGGNTVTVTEGMPFIDMVKPNNPMDDKLSFNLKHSLAKVKFTIDYIADAITPGYSDKVINADETRIYVRSIAISGWATEGALNLNNTEAGLPLWKDVDGVKDLSFDDVTFFDGRKDGKEGDTNGAQNNENPKGLNPEIIENYDQAVAGTPVTFGGGKTPGVTNVPQLLFGGSETANDGYFYVIPRNEDGASVDIKIVYDVETIDGNLAGLLSDGATHGLSTENIISKEKIFGDGVDFEPGKQYLVKIHLGMTSVKIEAEVTEWVPANTVDVDLPDNQDPTVDGAINMAYEDFDYAGEFSINADGDVEYDPTGAAGDNTKILADFARFIGALHKVCGVEAITYDSKEYKWDEEAVIAFELGVDGAPLKGSNFIWVADEMYDAAGVPVWRTDPDWDGTAKVLGTDYATLMYQLTQDASTLMTSGVTLTTDVLGDVKIVPALP